ncbi:MAG: GPP34 family phosphoprotein, partial [Catenulispora sp.]|nr:GPP34 family phosphoprotein [Catenulispora sp.]
MERLTLRDELYLLAHDDRGEPRIHTGSLSIGLAGACLIDLVIARRLTVDRGRLQMQDTSRTNDAISDWIIAQLVTSNTMRELRWWLAGIAGEIYDRTSGGLHAKGIVTKTTQRRLLGTTTRYPPVNDSVIGPIRAMAWYVVHGRERPDDQCAALCGLLGVLRLEDTLIVGV